jgi:hypothetical protein
LLGRTAEQGVVKPGISSGTEVSLGQAAREVDSSMIGHFEPENRAAPSRRIVQPAAHRREIPFKVAANQMTQYRGGAKRLP